MQKQSGFTLLELMVTIAIFAVISAIAIPSFIGWVPRYKLGGAARDVLAVLQKTRLQAVKDNTDYTITFNTANEAYTAFIDDGAGTPDEDPVDGIPDGRANGLREATETLLVAKPLPSGINITGTTLTGNSVSFSSQGLASEAGAINMQNARGETRRIQLQIAGGARILPFN
jgi:type IV fimbrial biogenesis protein FimT